MWIYTIKYSNNLINQTNDTVINLKYNNCSTTGNYTGNSTKKHS